MSAVAVPGADEEGIEPQQENMDYELLKALQKGDAITVERFFSQEVSITIDLSDADDIADQAGRRSCRGVTTGGNSALHIAADFGDLKLAELICTRDSSLLRARNAAKETPLHCAARARADQIVSHFISVAKEKEDGSWLEAVLHAKDQEGKTALYTAAQEGHAAAARVLMNEDPGLAAIVDNEGISPLYVAVLSGSLEIVQILIGYRADGGDTPEASYAGPNGQTALHAATVIENPEIAEKLLQWNSILTKKVDKSKRTPIHYLARTSNHHMVRQLLKHDTSPAYFSDSKGLCPIHVAAMKKRSTIISELINSCPDMFELVDSGGRNFLHVAIQHKQEEIVQFVCGQQLNWGPPLLPLKMMNARDSEGNTSLHLAVESKNRMMNARDSEGNTPLHLAVESKNRTIVSLLLVNRNVQPSIVNKNDETPLDIAIAELNFGLYFTQLGKRNWIYECLKRVGAINGPRGLGHLFDEKLTQPDLKEEVKKYKDASQNLIVASVLIATVTFAAVFTMPGGYIADDHQNGGSPTLGRKYAFKVFIIAGSVAFTYSVIATLGILYAGSLVADPSRWIEFIVRTQDLISTAALFMVTAFAMSLYVQLAPLSKPIVIVGCTAPLSFTLLMASLLQREKFLLAEVLTRRMGWCGMFKHYYFIFNLLSLAPLAVLFYIFLLPLLPTN